MPRVKKFEIEDISKMTITQCRSAYKKLKEQYLKLTNGAYCHECGEFKGKDKFYKSPKTASGLIPVCKECLYRIGTGYDEKTKETHETKETVIAAMRKADLPFLQDLYDNSCTAITNEVSGKKRGTGYSQMITCLQSLPQYFGMTFADSDFYSEDQLSLINKEETNNGNKNNTIPDNEIGEQFEQNKKDAIRLLGYDPFENESLSEQPFLYATLIGYLDAAEEANDDRMRLSSIIEIVKGFNHIEKMNDIIARLMDDSAHIESNIGTIKNLEETKSKITASVLKLAADNGISLKHSVNSTKGENTWTGKVRKMKEMNLRDAEVNLYDAEYSAGLSQVADISNASILKQIMLDENDSADMIIQQRELITKYKKIADEYEEKARILLRENIDLKALIKENGIDI